MENAGIKESTKQELTRTLLIWTTILGESRWITVPRELRDISREDLRALGYTTRLLPFVKLQLCQCGGCKLRIEYGDFDFDNLGQNCTAVFACESQLTRSESVMIGRTYK